jgi:tetratricopeptide (TPR) repeat protein
MSLSTGDVAAAHLGAKDYWRAADVLRTALADDPDNARLLVQYAQACLGMKDYVAAEAAAQAALAAAPDNELALRLFTLALHGQNRTLEALSIAYKMVGEHPHAYLAQYTYATLLHESGHAREALTVVDQALRLDPRSPDSLVLRGDIHRSMSSTAAAEADYCEALRLQPDHGVAMHNLAVSRLRWGSLGEAVRGLLAAGWLNPALEPLVRDNIGLAVTKVLRMATASVVFLAVALIVVAALHDDALPTVIPRIVAGALAAALVVPLVWVVRTMPRSTLSSVLRQRFLSGVRMALIAVAVLLGVMTAALGSNPVSDMAGTLLLFGVFGLTVLGWVTGA